MAEAVYRAFIGRVQFPPREGSAGGKDVRNITVRATGGKDQSVNIGATLWPSHAHVSVAEGDVVFVEGKFTQTKGDKDGAPVTYNNLSVTQIKNFGAAENGRKDGESTSSKAAKDDEPADDDIPF